MKTKNTKQNKKDVQNNKLKTVRNYFLIALIIGMFIFTFTYSPSLTGLATGVNSEIVEEINVTFDSYSAYSFELIGKPSSFKLSGTVEGDAKIYLLKGFQRYLVYETTENSGNLLTGFAISGGFIIENETVVEVVNETVTEEVVNETIEEVFNETVVEVVNETIEEVFNETVEEIIESNESTIEEVINETVEEIIENVTETVESPEVELGTISFSNSCVETCNLEGFDETVELVVEVNGTLTLTKLIYTVEGFEEIIEEEIVSNETVNETIGFLNETESNITLINETQVEEKLIIGLQNIACKEFKESTIWSSGFSRDEEGSTNYNTWYPKNNCTTVNASDCFIGKIEVKTRSISTDYLDLNSTREGYVQISEPDESICDNPSAGNYSRYISYDNLFGSEIKSRVECGDSKNNGTRCGVELTDFYDYYTETSCFGIKTHSTQYLITDVFEIHYTLCGDRSEIDVGGENES